jgi:hypothetical protein
MLDNNTYNLMMQMVEENQSLWRLKNHYMKETPHCDACGKFWSELTAQKEKNVAQLEQLIKSHLA